MSDALTVKQRRDVASSDVTDEPRHDDEEAHERNLKEEQPEADGGGEDRCAGIGVVAQRLEREPHRRRRAARRLESLLPPANPPSDALPT